MNEMIKRIIDFLSNARHYFFILFCVLIIFFFISEYLEEKTNDSKPFEYKIG